MMTTATAHTDASVPPNGLARSRDAARSRAADESGQALVEFALVMPILVVLMFGIALFGLALNGWIDETHLANEAARWVAVNSERGKGEIKREEFIKWITQQADSSQVKNAAVTICSPGSAVGEPVTVKLKYSYSWLGLNGLLGIPANETSTTFTSTATMRIEVAPKEKYETTC